MTRRKRMRHAWILLAGLATLAGGLAPGAAGEAKTPQGLEEMFRRKARLATNAWPRKTLESARDNFTWQPETLCFNDSRTGREVWRMTATPNLKNYYHNDIDVSPWSADGRRMGLTSWRLSEAHSSAARDEVTCSCTRHTGSGRLTQCSRTSTCQDPLC